MTIRLFFFIALALLAFAAPAGAQEGEEAAVRAIRERYAAIQREEAGYRCVAREVMDRSLEGGEVRVCFAGEALRKITAKFYGETGRVEEEYFFQDGEAPFFVFRRFLRYEKPFGPVAKTMEHRFYFVDGRLVRWVDGKRTVPLESAEVEAVVDELLESARDFARMARAR